MKLLEILSPNKLFNRSNGYKKQTPWWVEVSTTQPKCLYYFGPFDSLEEATHNQMGYIEDLREENAQGIKWRIKQTQPQALTVFEE